MSNSTDQLGQFAAELTYEALPADVVAHAKLCLLDTVGCAVYGATLEWSRILQKTVSDLNPDGPSAIWGTDRTSSSADAALANGSAVHAFELDDLHQRSILHPGSVVVPAAMAVAEQNGKESGTSLLTAIVAGYEVGARVGMSVGAAHLLQGWHPTGTHGTFAATAAAGSILGLSPGQMANALGIAGSQSGGLMAAQFEAMVKRFHAGRAAQSGVYAASLAGNGYTGIADVFENEYGGYLGTVSPTHDASALVAGLGTTWETLVVGFKPYSTNGSCHPALDALFDLRKQDDFDVADFDHVDIFVSSATKEHVGWDYVPDSVTTAQMNLPYIFSVALVDGDAFVEQFSEERIADPVLVELSRRVNVLIDPEIDAQGDSHRHFTRMEIHLVDGRVLADSRKYGRGNVNLPLTVAEVEEKYFKLVAGSFSRQHAQHVRRLVDDLDGATTVKALVSSLTSSACSTCER